MSNEHSELFRAAEGVTLDGAKPVVRLPSLDLFEAGDPHLLDIAYRNGVKDCADALREQGFEVTHDD